VAELAIRTIDCGIVAMAAPGYGGPSPRYVGLLMHFNHQQFQHKK